MLTFATVLEVSGAHFVYVSQQNSNSVAVYRMDPATGELEPQSPVSLPGGPASLDLSPDRNFLYAAQRSAKSLSAFTVNRSTGALSLLNTIAAPDNPAYVATDKTGKYLLSAYFAAGRMAVHGIDGDGKLLEEPIESLAIGSKAHAIRTDPSNRYLYVPMLGENAIFQAEFDATMGKVRPLSPARVETEPGAGPRILIFHGGKNFLYVVNQSNSTVTAYAFDAAMGHLFHLQTISTLPENHGGGNACADIKITPDNRYLYASNRGHNSLAAFRVDPLSGRLTPIGHYATQPVPRSFDIDPSGNFVFSAGETSDKLASYRINQNTGELQPLQVYPTGKSPTWVLAVYLGEGAVSSARPARQEAGAGQGPKSMTFGEVSVGGNGIYDILGRRSGSQAVGTGMGLFLGIPEIPK